MGEAPSYPYGTGSGTAGRGGDMQDAERSRLGQGGLAAARRDNVLDGGAVAGTSGNRAV